MRAYRAWRRWRAGTGPGSSSSAWSGTACTQLLFLGGVKRTSVANGSLILGTTPVVVALLTAWAGHERVPPRRWVGAAISFLGLAIVVGQKVDWSTSGHLGDALMMASTVCWATYSVASVPILRTHSPLVVTGYSIAIGALLYPGGDAGARGRGVDDHLTPQLAADDCIGGLCPGVRISHLGYTSVQRAGSTRTAAWSNVTPVIAILIAAVWLGEPIALNHVIGSAAIFTGLFITRRA